MKRRRHSKGYAASAEGALTGAFVLAVVGVCAGAGYSALFVADDADAFAFAVPPVVGLALGGYAGAVVGCYAALRLGRQPAAAATAALLAVMLGVLVLVWYRLEHYAGTSSVVECIGSALALALPVAARHLVLLSRARLDGSGGADTRLARISFGTALVTTVVLWVVPVDDATRIAADRGRDRMMPAALVLVAAIPLAFERSRSPKVAMALAASLLAMGVFASADRAGIFHLPAALLMVMALWAPAGADERA